MPSRSELARIIGPAALLAAAGLALLAATITFGAALVGGR